MMFLKITRGETEARVDCWVTLELDAEDMALPWEQLAERFIKPAFKQLLFGHIENKERYVRARDHFEGNTAWPSRDSIVNKSQG